MKYLLLVAVLLLVLGAAVMYLAWSVLLQYQAAIAEQEHDRLIRTDPIVGIWRSHDASFNGSSEYFYNYNLTIYNDHTFVIYDRVNDTRTYGIWEKTGNYYTTDLYAVRENGRTFPPITISHGLNSGYLQYSYTYRDSPPYSDISYINYELVDYYIS